MKIGVRKKLSIMLNGKKLTAEAGTKLAGLLARAPHKGPFTPIGAIVNGRLDGLYYELKSDAEIETVDLSSREGMDIYRRSASFLFCASVRRIAPKAKVVVGQSISNNYFFEIRNLKVTLAVVGRIASVMKGLVSKNLPMQRQWTIIEEAIQIFEKEDQKDKILLLRQHRRSEIPLVEIGQYHEIAYGPVAHTTKAIQAFKLHLYEHGVILGFPDANGALAETILPQPKLFSTYLETKRWHELVGVSNVANLNEHCIKGTISDLVKVAEALHERKIAAIADEIASRKGIRLILVAGPSGSGKTTFTKRLAIQLKLHGIKPVSLSLDSYYKDRINSPRHSDGTYNFESLEALDTKLLNKQLKQLLDGKPVKIPCYNFPLGKRESNRTIPMKLKKDQVFITEGIHGLNEKLSPAIAREKKFKIYVSALTQLSLDDHNRFFTTDTRLVRRIVRDRLFRGASASETISIWPSVRAGESKHIFPYQEDADVIFNSALAYEPALLKPFAERFLMEVPRGHRSFMEATRLLRFLAFVVPILPQEVPHTSIIREFIGGSSFRYG